MVNRDGERLEIPATKLQAFPNFSSQEVSPGQVVELAVQALDDDNETIQDSRINFVIVDEASLEWAPETERVGRVASAVSKEQGFMGLTAGGLALVKLLVKEDAQMGEAKVFAILQTPTSEDADDGLVEFTFTVVEPQQVDEMDVGIAEIDGDSDVQEESEMDTATDTVETDLPAEDGN